MYNRYIPQSDGSYRRRSVQEEAPTVHPPAPIIPAPPAPECAPPPPPPRKHTPLRSLTQLLPKGLDTGDLFVIVLLLLMAGDCEEDKNTMLLTLALYLFL